jgi:nitroimidazol reductase NimA-like FMN-containing flavoprotein (pyridoxamine 5'-phosphate oxidase superfamily)
MIGALTPERIEHMLHLEVVGRIGCHADGRTYVVPISYAYDGEAIYGYSFEGLKLRIMRQNPAVCFEVDRFEVDSHGALASWESIVVQGRFEELSGEEAASGRALLVDRFRRLWMPWLTKPPRAVEEGWVRQGGIMPVVFRIVPLEKSGRFERVEQR